MQITITHISTACILLDINGFKILTDPVLDPAGVYYHHGFGAFSRKTEAPALQNVDLSRIDLVLLSHHQHKDNFDQKGKETAMQAAAIISTPQAAKAIKGVIGLKPWESHAIPTDKLPGLKITATPAQHHPWWLPEFFSGKVIGFVIEYTGQDNGVIYLSGDTVFFKGIPEIAARFPKIDLGIFNVGSAQFRYLTGWGQYTMDSRDFLKAVKTLNPGRVIPIHLKGWTHFKETESVLKSVVFSSELTKNRTVFLESGVKTEMT